MDKLTLADAAFHVLAAGREPASSAPVRAQDPSRPTDSLGRTFHLQIADGDGEGPTFHANLISIRGAEISNCVHETTIVLRLIGQRELVDNEDIFIRQQLLNLNSVL